MLTRTTRYALYRTSLVGTISKQHYSALGDAAKKAGDKIDETLQKGKEAFNKSTADANAKADELKEKAKDKVDDAADAVKEKTK